MAGTGTGTGTGGLERARIHAHMRSGNASSLSDYEPYIQERKRKDEDLRSKILEIDDLELTFQPRTNAVQHLKACAVRRQRAAASRVRCPSPSPSSQRQFDPSRGISSPMVNGSKAAIVDIGLSDCDQAAGSKGHLAAMHTPPIEKAVVDEDDEDEEDEGEGVGEGEEECMPSASSICFKGDDSICNGGDHDSDSDSDSDSGEGEDAAVKLAHSAYNASSYAEPRAGASKAVREVDSSTLSRDSNPSESGVNEVTCLQEGEINAFMFCSPTAGDAVEQNRGSDHRSVMRVNRSWGTGAEVDNCHERLYQQGMKRNSKRGQGSEVTTCSIN